MLQVQTKYFDSLAALEAASMTLSDGSENYEMHHLLTQDDYTSKSRSVITSQRWYGVSDWRQVAKIKREGWPEGVSKMLEKMGSITPPAPPRSIKRRKIRGDNGDEYDWQAGAQGAHDTAWTRPSRRATHAPKVVTLFTDLSEGTSWKTDSENFFWRGAACLAIADSLTSAGYSVQILAGNKAEMQNSSETMRATYLTVKEASAPLDLSSLAAVLCLAGYYRTTFIGLNVAQEVKKVGGGISSAQTAETPVGAIRIAPLGYTAARKCVIDTLASFNQ